MNIFDYSSESVFVENKLDINNDFFTENYNYKDTSSKESGNKHSEDFGFGYGKDYHKNIKKGDKKIYKLVKYDEEIYTNLVTLNNSKGKIKSIKKVSGEIIVDSGKSINIDIPDKEIEKRYIIQGRIIFKVEYYVNENKDVIYETKFIVPFSKIIPIPININEGIKVSVKIEYSYFKIINSECLILSGAVLFLLYEKDVSNDILI